MKAEDSPGAAPLPDEDGNGTPMRSPAPLPSPSPSPEAPSPVASGAGEGAAAGGGVVPMNEEQSPSVVRSGGAAVMSKNVSHRFWIGGSL
jgi:hypothetical protein